MVDAWGNTPRIHSVRFSRKPAIVRSEIIPPNRLITIALVVGLLALIVWGASRGDPVTIAIVAALFVFFALPALLLFTLNRRARAHPAPPSDEADHH